MPEEYGKNDPFLKSSGRRRADDEGSDLKQE